MCGICGRVSRHALESIDTDVLRGMTDILHHRGPDHRATYQAPGIGLGICRLKIIDPDGGNQPISNESGRIVLICNGEIYNYRELRQKLLTKGHRFRTHSDVEVIVHLYEEDGIDCLQSLRGMFAFALWDVQARKLLLCRDRFGIKPLYYHLSSSGLSFASEQKSVLASGQVYRTADLSAVRDIFRFGFPVGDKTLIKDIRSLPPAHYMIYEGGRCTIRPYWDARFSDGKTSSSDRELDKPEWWAEAFLEKLRESVRLHLRSDMPVGVWLSPGIDSNSITRLMCELVDNTIHCFSVSFPGSNLDEISRKSTLTDRGDFSLIQHRIECRPEDIRLLPRAVWHCENPLTAGIEIPRMLLSKAASQHVKVVLTGEGADEVLGGYPWYRADKILRPLGYLPYSLRKRLSRNSCIFGTWPGASQIILRAPEMNVLRYQAMVGPAQVFREENRLFGDALKDSEKSENDSDALAALPNEFSSWNPYHRLQYLDMRLRLPNSIVLHLDRSTMAYSVEARVPFLDHEFVEFCNRVPVSLKMRWLEEKHLLRRAMRPLLPKDIVKRRKFAMTSPVNQWLIDSIPDFALQLLSPDSVREKGYFNADFVDAAFREHRKEQRNNGKLLLGVLGIHLWDELFLRRKHFSFTDLENSSLCDTVSAT